MIVVKSIIGDRQLNPELQNDEKHIFWEIFQEKISYKKYLNMIRFPKTFLSFKIEVITSHTQTCEKDTFSCRYLNIFLLRHAQFSEHTQNTHECDFYTHSVLFLCTSVISTHIGISRRSVTLTRTSAISTSKSVTLTGTSVIMPRKSVIFTRRVWFLHAECDFHIHECDIDTYEIDIDTNECECEYETHECDFYSHELYFNTLLVTKHL
jgi:hypothetical protein